MEHEGHLVGRGVDVLDWMKRERTTHRYGTVCLYAAQTSDEALPLQGAPFEGQHGRLVALVRETRRPRPAADPRRVM